MSCINQFLKKIYEIFSKIDFHKLGLSVLYTVVVRNIIWPARAIIDDKALLNNLQIIMRISFRDITL
jgi:hypothetical protein